MQESLQEIKAQLRVITKTYERFNLSCEIILEQIHQAEFGSSPVAGKVKYATEHKLASASAQAYVQKPFSLRICFFSHVFVIATFNKYN